MSDSLVTVIVPTMDNHHYLNAMLSSFVTNTDAAAAPYRIIVVNNGRPGSLSNGDQENISIIEAGGNKGWEGALNLGLKATDSPMVLFANDDIHIVPGNPGWLSSMVGTLLNEQHHVGAVGPVSNFVMGHQHMQHNLEPGAYSVGLLIGFCVLVRRDALDEVGGVTEGLPGGDDFDLSIRLVKAGWKLVIQANAYVHHWGCTTGVRVEGDKWNSKAMIRDTRNELIRRHKLRPYLATLNTQPTLL